MIPIGILSVAHLHADSYAAQLHALPNARLVGIWDSDATRRTTKAAQYDCDGFDDLGALLDRCEAVVVCAENVHHRALTEAAARAGKPVLCEKPLATTPEDARAMVDFCDAAGVPLMTAFPCRFAPAFGSLLAAVQNGDLGEILAVRGTNHGKCPGGWFVDRTLSGGGTVMDHTVHVTDLLRVLLGSEVQSVYCEADNRLLHGDFDDTGFLALNFESGIFGTLDASWSRPASFPTWGDVTLGVTGTKGVLEMNLFAQESVLYSDKTGGVTYQGWGSDIDYGMVAAFVEAVESGSPVPITGIDGLRAVEVVEAAYASAKTNQPAAVRRR
ncbi:MAG: Gfo/Idh/MocA family oxidoreductase [Cytophagales bacterium]|nr:Gfo/Idh/MocA family oxidoreductase [Armatimonadota bacterium]